ncbi:N-acetylmuramoyl-L-alanine amidase [Fusobacterium vincentii ATCC 49256]|uniref:N-acetylmuramoyl-L-alanine amidase n=1 Tax=Fusobacterium vincentii ATCC 49256 TaxID=209882 RepID=Q7P4D3_FUSVC|nr:N-acetylmuramoyl-L-alanine amidase [Fusobacterium vincentii ATCC 49256]
MLLSVVVLSEEKGKIFNPSNYIICIDPGHQTKGNNELEAIAPNSTKKKAKVTTGTRGVFTKKYESELMLEIGLKLKDSLEKKGYKVIMTRTINDVNISNIERALFANKKQSYTIILRLHADGSENKNTYGASVLTSSPKNKYTEKTQKESEKFSKILLEEYVKSTGAKNRGVIYRDDLTGTNWAEVTNTLIELGFMSNTEEDKKLSDEKYQEKIINGLVNGIEKYLKSN